MAMKKKKDAAGNPKGQKSSKALLLWLLALLVLVAPLTYVGGKFIMKRRAKVWRTEGIAASRAGDHEHAAVLLARYLKPYPRDPEALRYYVASREVAELPNGQHFADTVAALKLLISEESDTLNDRRHLLELYTRLRRWDEALDVSNTILALQDKAKQPPDLRTLEMKTEALDRLKDYRDELTTAELWAKHAPDSLRAHMAVLATRRRLDQPPDSIIADAQSVRDKHKDDPEFEFLQGYAYALAGKNKEAATWLKTAAKHPGLKEDFAKILGAEFDNLGQTEESLALLQKLVKEGGSPEIRHLLARRCWERAEWEQVAALLSDVNPSDANSDATLVAFKATALGVLKKSEEYTACRTALSGRKQAAARAWTLLLPRILDASTAVDNKQVVTECQAALTIDSRNAYLRFYMGEANARMGELELAVAAWRQASGDALTWNVPPIRLIDALLQQGRSDQAGEVAGFLSRRDSAAHDLEALRAITNAWLANIESGTMGHSDDLLSIVGQIQNQLPGEAGTLLIAIQVNAESGNKPKAIQMARSVLNRTPPPGEQLLLRIAIISLKSELGLEEECFARSEQAHGVSASLAYSKAIAKAYGGHVDEGLKQFDEMAQRSGTAKDLPWQMARAQYLDVTQSPGAREAWIALGNAFPSDVRVQHGVVGAQSVRKEWEFMQLTIDRLRALTGEKGLAWRLARARLLVENPRNETDTEQGSVLLNEILRSTNSPLPEAHALLARALMSMKQQSGAINQMTAAVHLDPTSVPYALQLAALYQLDGSPDKTRQEIDRIAPRLRVAEHRRQAALLLSQQGQADRAIELLEAGKNQGDKDDKEDLLLAVLYRKQGRFDKAEAAARKLLEHPDVSIIQFASSLYVAMGRRNDAEDVLERLDWVKLEPGAQDLLWASYYAEAGDLGAAIKHYRRVTQQAPSNAVAWRALASCQVALSQINEALATIKQAAQALPADKPLAAINEQADLLREAGSDEGLRSAMVAVIRNPSQSAAGIELLRTVIEERHSGDMVRLASRLQTLADAHPGFLPIQVQLVQCLLGMGRTNDAIATAQKAIKAYPNDVDPAKLAVQACASARRWTEMQAAAETWKRRAPDAPAVPDLAIAQAQIGMKQYDAAIRQLQPYIAAAWADPEKHSDQVMTHSVALMHLGQSAAVADRLWPLANKGPNWRIHWIQLALEMNNIKEASAWLDRVAGIVSPDAVTERVTLAEAYDRLGRSTDDKDLGKELIAKASRMIGENADDPNAAAPVLSAAAAQAERCGDPKKAEAYYRRALAKDPNFWAGQNNLAMIIANKGGDLQEARTLATLAIKNAPRATNAYDTLAYVESKAGNAKTAAETIKMAVRLEPENPAWRVLVAQYLLDAGDFSGAAKAVGELDSLDLHNLKPDVRQRLDAIRRKLKGSKLG